jgi:hypothetical protein
VTGTSFSDAASGLHCLSGNQEKVAGLLAIIFDKIYIISLRLRKSDI